MFVYDSRSVQYKQPFGAVPTGEPVRFCVVSDCEAVALVYRRDYEPESRLPMQRDADGRFLAELTLDVPQVYWYYFECVSAGQTLRYYRNTADNQPVLAEDGATWQLTVYKAPTVSADRWQGAVMYQIFPDRFARSGKVHPGVPTDRYLHKTTDEPPTEPEPADRAPCSDYFGGDLAGIARCLDRLQALSVDLLYLNPIFEAHSNHRYNTADYLQIDPMLGDESEFSALLADCRRCGIGVLLDGVFSHTGDDSIYFNRYGRYPTVGAYQSEQSVFAPWFTFRAFPDDYLCWWNIPTLPEVDETNPVYLAYIRRVIEKWQPMGIAGWRLDVADELPDVFLEALRGYVKGYDPQAFLLGEVWEDATTKMREGVRREYLLGDQLDSVMNYPFRTAILDWVLHGNGAQFAERVLSIIENYPPPALHRLMNLLGTHDTPRVLTVLGGDDIDAIPRSEQGDYRMTPEQHALAVQRLLPAIALQFTLPGIPCIYYGDEQCMTGAGDPYCRGFYSEAQHDDTVYRAYQTLSALRHQHPCYRDGATELALADDEKIVFTRKSAGSAVTTMVSRRETTYTPAGEVLFAHRFDGRTAAPFAVVISKA